MKRLITMFLSLTVLVLVLVPTVVSAQQNASPMVEIIKGVSMRDAPSLNSNVIRTLKTGEYLTIIDASNNNYFLASDYAGTIGYFSKRAEYSRSLTADEVDQITWSGPATILNLVKLYPEPTTSSAYLRYLEVYEHVTIVRKVSSLWYEVLDHDNSLRYVSTEADNITIQPVPIIGTDATPEATAVIEAGQKYLGTIYEFGSVRNDPTTFDCSDFTQTAFKEGANLEIPSDSATQAIWAKANGLVRQSIADLQPGDIVFFMDSLGSDPAAYVGIDKTQAEVSHVGIYLGNGRIIHATQASSSFSGVKYATLTGTALEYRFLFGANLLTGN